MTVVRVGAGNVPDWQNSLCSSERWAGNQSMLGTVARINNFGLYSESHGASQQSFEIREVALADSYFEKINCGSSGGK